MTVTLGFLSIIGAALLALCIIFAVFSAIIVVLLLLHEQYQLRFRMSEIHRAAYLGNTTGVMSLLDSGVDIESVAKNGETPLLSSVTSSEMMNMLIARGADVNYRNIKNGETALIKCMHELRYAQIRCLLDAAADINIADNQGDTPWHVALSLVEISNPDSDVDAPIIHCINALLDYSKPDVNLKNRNGDTALCIAVRKKNMALVERLIRYGANPMIKNVKGKDAKILASEIRDSKVRNTINNLL